MKTVKADFVDNVVVSSIMMENGCILCLRYSNCLTLLSFPEQHVLIYLHMNDVNTKLQLLCDHLVPAVPLWLDVW